MLGMDRESQRLAETGGIGAVVGDAVVLPSYRSLASRDMMRRTISTYSRHP